MDTAVHENAGSDTVLDKTRNRIGAEATMDLHEL